MITIVVLLILAGITVGTLTSNNGVVQEATNAKQQTEKKRLEEQIDLALIQVEEENRNPTIEDVINKLIKKQIIKDENSVNRETGDITTKNPSYLITGKLNDYITQKLKPGETAKKTEKNNYTDGTDTATIPEGFTVSNKTDETTIKTGLVVIGPDGSEFVWVPVPTPVSDTEENRTTNKAMAIKNENNYKGLLYNFTSTGSTVRSGCTTMDIENGQDSREPAYITDPYANYGDLGAYNNVGITKASLQNEYNNMISSIEIYNGFYVGRYETSMNGTKAQSKKNQTSANASDENTKLWYGLYEKQKKYATDIVTKGSVVSSMIWGSQWDAMMNWMQKEGIDVSLETPIQNASKNTTRITGSKEEDKLNNIYDLLGNSQEWTLEGNFTTSRVPRGGYYDSVYQNTAAYRDTQTYPPGDPESVIAERFGSRMTLYIK